VEDETPKETMSEFQGLEGKSTKGGNMSINDLVESGELAKFTELENNGNHDISDSCNGVFGPWMLIKRGIMVNLNQISHD